MGFYWVEFTDRKPGTIEVEASSYVGFHAAHGKTESQIKRMQKERDDAVEAEIRERAAPFGTLSGYSRLPYPAEPRLDVRSDCPSFCYSPRQCKGRGSCPKSYACSE